MRRIQAFVLVATLAVLAAAKKPAGKTEYFVYVGTYSRDQSKGIYVCRFDAASGNLSAPRLAAESENPSFLAVHPSGRFLYAANEVDNYGDRTGSVTAYAVDRKSGDLKLLNRVSSKGAGPCYVTVDRSSKDLLVANYSGGSVAVLPIGADGRLAEASAFVQHSGSSVGGRQRGPHAHSINLSSDNRFASRPISGWTSCSSTASIPSTGRWPRTTRLTPSSIPARVPGISRFIPGAATSMRSTSSSRP